MIEQIRTYDEKNARRGYPCEDSSWSELRTYKSGQRYSLYYNRLR